MAEPPSLQTMDILSPPSDGNQFGARLSRIPWWFVGLILIGLGAIYIILTKENYNEAFNFIKPGIKTTINISLVSYGLSLVLGLFAGLGRLSKNVFFNNLARLYIEFVRGIPMLVLIFFIAFVGVPIVIDLVNGMGIGNLDIQAVSMENRAVIALAVTYGAFLAEIFRAGIQSIGHGQVEAAYSLGMSGFQAMRFIVLPQAVRNVLPALANDFVAMVKDSSLVSVLAVRDITQTARLYAGSTFRFREAYVTISIMYLTMTVILSLLVQLLERRMQAGEHR
ncbi:MAG TPA: amino acid ABC transporter permease [Chloroflexi bacterium]|nr:amino acid ABC transporter permease [Chloroflexota bacterium]